MELPQEEIKKARELLENAQNILIISHKNPDGDTVGANLALKLALEQQWHKKVTPACADPIPASMDFLPGYSDYVRDFNPADYDLFLSVDAGAHYLLKFHETKPEILDKEKTTLINIDHHPSNDFYGQVNIVQPTAAATCLMIYFFLEYCQLNLTPQIATCLLYGLYYDTGSLMHSNTDAEVYRIAADLLRKGADLKKTVKKQFKTTPVQQMRLWGRVLDRARINEKQAVVSAVTEKDFEECDATPEDLTGVIDFLNAVPETKFSMLLAEDTHGNVKGSFRTQHDHIDLSELAGTFGGGGHKKAAGFTIPGHIKEKVVWEITP